jgi:subtilisin-like proprotein convertase family protein
MRMRRRPIRSALLVSVLGALAFATSPAAGATFPANDPTLGAIPDGPSACSSGVFGLDRDVTFTVGGLVQQITKVEVTFALNPAHTFAGDLHVALIAPDAASHTIFGRTGSTTGSICGYASNIAGPYTFSDLAALPPLGGWWQAASTATASQVISAGTYRTTAAGGAGAISPAPATLMTPAFASSDPNGVWTLRFKDSGFGDVGTVESASLTIDTGDAISPQTTFTKKPRKTTSRRTVTFKFKSSEGGSTFQCKLGRKAYKKCSSPFSITVGLGTHTLRVRAIDKAGNKDATPVAYSWRTVAP